MTDPFAPQASPAPLAVPAESPSSSDQVIASPIAGQQPEMLLDPESAARVARMRRQPPSHFGWALLATVLCFPLGLVSMFFSSQVPKLWANGDAQGAKKASNASLNVTLASVAIGVVLWAVGGLFALDTYWRMNHRPATANGLEGSSGIFGGFREGILADLQDSVVERIEDVFGEDIADTVDEMIPEDLPTEIPTELPADVPEDVIPDEVADQLPTDEVQDIVDEQLPGVTDQIPGEIPEGVTEQIPDMVPNPLGN